MNASPVAGRDEEDEQSGTDPGADGRLPKRRQPAMTDVASLAGVSHMTVSRVLNDAQSVAVATRNRVLAAIRELDYRPNTAARALVTGQSRTLGVVSFDTTLYGPASTLYGIERAARSSGYFISIASLRTLDHHSIGEAVENLRGQAVDGIIVIAPHVSAAKALQYLPRSLPIVAVEGDGRAGPVPIVAVDQVSGGRIATEHLLGLGHETVWHVAGPTDWLEAQGREEGWGEALRAAGIELPPVFRGDWSPRSGYEVGHQILKGGTPTAVFVANDQMALGLLRAFREAGVDVPSEVSLVGFDDVPEAAYFSPPLTTLRQDFAEVGRRTFDLLLQQIDGHQDGDVHVIVQPELVVRESSRVPRRR